MPIQLTIYERRDNGSREAMGNSALGLCRTARKREGITSARYYWTGDSIAFLYEGEADALNNPYTEAQQEYGRAAFVLMDNARLTLNSRLIDARDALQMQRTSRQ